MNLELKSKSSSNESYTKFQSYTNFSLQVEIQFCIWKMALDGVRVVNSSIHSFEWLKIVQCIWCIVFCNKDTIWTRDTVMNDQIVVHSIIPNENNSFLKIVFHLFRKLAIKSLHILIIDHSIQSQLYLRFKHVDGQCYKQH